MLLIQKLKKAATLSRKALYENIHVAVNQDEWNGRKNGYL